MITSAISLHDFMSAVTKFLTELDCIRKLWQQCFAEERQCDITGYGLNSETVLS